MSNGIGCTCHAYSESECSCDADWTPQEVYDLRRQLDLTKDKLSHRGAELTGAFKQCEDLHRANKELTTEIQRLKAALSKYGHHIEGCGHGWQCNCGFLELFR